MSIPFLVLGTSYMEISFNLFRLPEAGGTATDDGGVAYLPAGGAVFLSDAFSKLGESVTVLSKLGADLHGRRLYEYFGSLGADTSALKVDRDFPTGVILRLREASGVRTVLYPGANTAVTTDNLLSAFSAPMKAAVVDFSMPAPSALTAARIAADRGIPLILLPNGDEKDAAPESFPAADIVLMDAADAEKYTGILPQGSDSSLRAGLAVYKRFKCKTLVIHLGDRGTFLYDGKHYQMASAAPVYSLGKHAEANTAFGKEAFAAAFLHSYLENPDARRASEFAAVAYTLCRQKSTAIPYFASENEILGAAAL